MSSQNYGESDILDVCIKAGYVMLANGAETYRVEDTLYRIAASYGLKNINVFCIPTAVIITVQGQNEHDYTELLRADSGSTDLGKVALVNELSREITRNPLPLETVSKKLDDIQHSAPQFKEWQRVVGISIACACFVFIFGGNWSDFIPAGIAGGVGLTVFEKANNILYVTFFSQIIASFMTGMVIVVFMYVGLGDHMNVMIVSALMGLVPGMAITNSFRDLMAGHLVAGISLAAQALLTAAAIGVGIVLVLALI